MSFCARIFMKLQKWKAQSSFVSTSCTKLHANQTIDVKERGNKIIIYRALPHRLRHSSIFMKLQKWKAQSCFVSTSCTKLHANQTINVKERGNKIIIHRDLPHRLRHSSHFHENPKMFSDHNWRSSVSNFHLIWAINAESNGRKSFALWSTSLELFVLNKWTYQ